MDQYIVIRASFSSKKDKYYHNYFNGWHFLFSTHFEEVSEPVQSSVLMGCTGFSYDAFLLNLVNLVKRQYSRLFSIFTLCLFDLRQDYDDYEDKKITTMSPLRKNFSKIRNYLPKIPTEEELYFYYNTLIPDTGKATVRIKKKETDAWWRYKVTPSWEQSLLLISISISGSLGGFKLFYRHAGINYKIINEHSIQTKTYSNLNVILPVGAMLLINSTTPNKRHIDLHCKKISLEKVSIQAEENKNISSTLNID